MRCGHVLVALLLASCGGEAGGDVPDVRGTPAKTEGSESAEAPPWGPVTGARPMRGEDLVVRVADAPRTGAGPIRLELRNRSSDPIRVAPAWLHVSVFRDGARLRGCATREPRPLEGVDAIGAGESVFTLVPLPCALTSPGVYRVAVVVLTPEPIPGAPSAPNDARISGAGVIVVR